MFYNLILKVCKNCWLCTANRQLFQKSFSWYFSKYT